MVIQTLFIDLDETIYAASSGVWEAISKRMEQWMHDKLGIPWEEISPLRKELYQTYGTTLRGLKETREVDERDFIEYVHHVPLENFLLPDPNLKSILLHCPQRKLIFTNADKSHARRVLRQMNLEDCFEGIIDIFDMSPYCKPMPEAYQTALRIAGLSSAEGCVFIDDSPRNLAAARQLGFYTIQVGSPKAGYVHPPAGAHLVIPTLHNLPVALEQLTCLPTEAPGE